MIKAENSAKGSYHEFMRACAFYKMENLESMGLNNNILNQMFAEYLLRKGKINLLKSTSLDDLNELNGYKDAFVAENKKKDR